MFLIRKEANEYVDENGVYCSYKTLKIFGIKLYIEIFTTTSVNVVSQFNSEITDENNREYKDPVVVTGFKQE